MKRMIIIAAALVAACAFAYWWLSPAQVIKRRTHSFLETLTLEPGSGRATRQIGVYSLSGFLAKEVELDTPTIEHANGTFERGDLESGYSWLCAQAKEMRFDVREVHSVDVDDERGVIVFSVNALVELPSYRPADGNYRVTFDWRHVDDDWQLVKATWLESGD